MDSQDITVWGQVKPEWTWNERKRINGLCEWGRKFGLDGFMRFVAVFLIVIPRLTRKFERKNGNGLVSYNRDLTYVYHPLMKQSF